MSRVVVCTWGTTGGAEELLTARPRRRDRARDGARLVVVGPTADDLAAIGGRHGVVAVDRVVDPKLVTFGGDVAVEALCAVRGAQYDFRLLLVPQTLRRACRGAAARGPHRRRRRDERPRRSAPRAARSPSPPRLSAATRAWCTCSPGPPATSSGEHERARRRACRDDRPRRRYVTSRSTSACVEERVQVVARSEASGPRIEEADHRRRRRARPRREGQLPPDPRARRTRSAAWPRASRPIVDEGWAEPARAGRASPARSRVRQLYDRRRHLGRQPAHGRLRRREDARRDQPRS